jgi:hypothetical protein
MIYMAPYVILLIRAIPLGKVGRGWALEIETFLGLVKWHRVISAIWGVKKIPSNVLPNMLINKNKERIKQYVSSKILYEQIQFIKYW